MKQLVALILVALFPSIANAEETMTLDQVLEAAATRPNALATRDGANAADAAADAQRRVAIFPSVQLTGSAQQRSRELTLQTAMGALNVADKRAFKASVGIRQPILDASRLFYAAPAARLDAKAAAFDAERASDLYSADAAGVYFDILELDAQIASTDTLLESLKIRLRELTSLVDEGRAIERDRLRLQLALDDATLLRDNLKTDRKTLALALGHAVGRDEAVEPAPLTKLTTSTSQANRSDVRALKLRSAAIEKRHKAINAELIPTISLDAAWIFDDSLFADQDNFFAVTLNLSWTPLASGTRSARRRVLDSNASALRHQQLELDRRTRLEERVATSAFEKARAAVAVANKGVSDATEARRVTIERYKAGRETVGELLEVEQLLAERRSAVSIATIGVHRAHVAKRLANGSLLR